MRILITGSVGTGKTTLANQLGERLNIPVFHISDIIVDNRLYRGKDKVFDSYVPDEDALINYFRTVILSQHDDFIVDHHSFDAFSRHFFDAVFVLRADLKVLRSRLSEREYSEIKIEENLQCEIMEVVSSEAFERFSNVHELQSNNKDDLQNGVELICEISEKCSQEPVEEVFEAEMEE